MLQPSRPSLQQQQDNRSCCRWSDGRDATVLTIPIQCDTSRIQTLSTFLIKNQENAGLLGFWVPPGLLGPWALGPLGTWAPGLLGPWVPGLLGPWVLASIAATTRTVHRVHRSMIATIGRHPTTIGASIAPPCPPQLPADDPNTMC